VKEDVLEQIVDDYLQMEGYFTIHNVKFNPSPGHPGFDLRLDSVASDVVWGDTAAWENDATITKNLRGNPFRFLTLETMWSRVLATVTRTPASSEMGRLAQLLKAAGLTA